MKNNEINYKGLNKDKLSVLKRNQIKNKNIDTVILDRYNYNGSYEKNNEFKNIKNMIINNKKIPINSCIFIQNTRAENIYFLNKENIGGLTYPITMGNYEIVLFWGENADCNLKEIKYYITK